jgi:hypothetical protein
MPAPAVTPIEPLRVQAVESVHAAGERLSWRLDNEMEVRPHETPRVQAPAKAPRCLAKQTDERLPVRVVDEDVDSAGSARRHVEVAVIGENGARRAWHEKRP